MRQWMRTLGTLAMLGAATVALGQVPVDTPAALVPTVANHAAMPAAMPGQGEHVLDKTDVDTWLDGYFPAALRVADIPGAVVTIVKDGKILTARGFGYADRDKRTPVDPAKTLFRPGSVSKLFTWTAVMQQVETGKLDLDTDINTYLDFKIPPFDGKPVTLRQIMTHTGGFEETAKGIIYFDAKLDMPLGAFLKRWTPVRIFAPGTTPAYSNWATALAAYIVQRRSGEEFNAYLERHIFAPLGMHDTSFRQPLPAALAPQMAVGYPKPGEPSPGFEFIGPYPAGSESSSGTDMARFMIATLQGEIDGARVLKPETLAMMLGSPLAHVDPLSLVPPLNRMELGFFETNINGREVVGHLGDTEAFHTSLHLFRKEGVGLYISFNSPGKEGAVGPLRTAVFQDFADRYFPNIAPPDGRVDAKTAAADAQAMAGTWEASRRAQTDFLSLAYLLGQAKVGVGPKGELVVPSLVGAGGRPRTWVEISRFVWRDVNGHDRLAAQVVGGQPVRWSYDLAAPFEVFDRVPVGRSGTWLLPALGAAAAVLLLTFLHWPVTALVRRRYRAAQALVGPARRAHRATRLLAGLDIVLFAGWGFAVTTMLDSPDAAAGGLDPVLIALQLAGIVVFVGAVLLSGWHLWLTWTDGRPWTRKAWNTLVFLSALLVLYVAVTFHLLTPSVHY